MSASLVGSEMCIRDRTALQLVHANRFAQENNRLSNGRKCRATQRHTTVSYTHLTLPTICSV
eukprot:14249563-Alexandrium_andersonii.AAC.1